MDPILSEMIGSFLVLLVVSSLRYVIEFVHFNSNED